MRRFIVGVIAASALAAVVATPASGSLFEHHFSVISKDANGRETNNGFEFKVELFAKWDHRISVGRGAVKCKDRGHRTARCRAAFHFDGTVGGYGNLLAKGNIGRHDNTLLVSNGNGDFDGVAGKLTVTTINKVKDKLHFDLIH